MELALQFVNMEKFSYLFLDSALQMLTVTGFGLYRDSESLAMVMVPLKKGDFYPKTSTLTLLHRDMGCHIHSQWATHSFESVPVATNCYFIDR